MLLRGMVVTLLVRMMVEGKTLEDVCFVVEGCGGDAAGQDDGGGQDFRECLFLLFSPSVASNFLTAQPDIVECDGSARARKLE